MTRVPVSARMTPTTTATRPRSSVTPGTRPGPRPRCTTCEAAPTRATSPPGGGAHWGTWGTRPTWGTMMKTKYIPLNHWTQGEKYLENVLFLFSCSAVRHLERFANAPFEVELYSNDSSVFIITEKAHLRHY